MADISFRPIRRYRISLLPASVSKYHTVSLRTRGMGVGQFLALTYKIVVPLGSFTRRCISRYLCTKLARLWMSSVSSPEEMICFPSGPRNSSKAFSSLPCIAATRPLLASSGDENVFWPRSYHGAVSSQMACNPLDGSSRHSLHRLTGSHSGVERD